MKFRNNKVLLAVLATGAVTTGSADAAVITWGSATDVVNTSDVSNIGTTVEAANLGYKDAGLNTVTVNGVEFTKTVQPAPLTSTTTIAYNSLTYNNVAPVSVGTSGDADYDNLLNSLAFGGGGNEINMTIAAGDLTVGKSYLVQVWFVDERSFGGTNATDARVMRIGDGNGNNVDLGNTTGSKLGQYAIGTFVADATSLVITLDAQGFGNAHLTAYQVREVPEPGSLALLGLGGLFVFKRRRRD